METNGHVKWSIFVGTMLTYAALIATTLIAFNSRIETTNAKIESANVRIETSKVERMLQFGDIRERLVRIEERLSEHMKGN